MASANSDELTYSNLGPTVGGRIEIGCGHVGSVIHKTSRTCAKLCAFGKKLTLFVLVEERKSLLDALLLGFNPALVGCCRHHCSLLSSALRLQLSFAFFKLAASPRPGRTCLSF